MRTVLLVCETGGVGEDPATLRATLGEVLDEASTRDRIRQIVHDALDSEHARKVECPECGTEFRAKLPDVTKQVQTIIALLEQKEGRPEQRSPEATVVTIVRPPL